MTRLPWLYTLLLVMGIALPACQQAKEGGSAEPAQAKGGEDIAVIRVKNFGEIRILFLPDKAPGHVENFRKLAREGFYNGTAFHRVIPNFMVQGGDPLSKDDNPLNDGTGGPGYTIKAEFNEVPHKRGIVSMARSRDPDSAGSQFFIVVADSDHLDGKYTVFGEVTSGMEVVDQIVATPKDRRNRPIENVVIESITLESKG